MVVLYFHQYISMILFHFSCETLSWWKWVTKGEVYFLSRRVILIEILSLILGVMWPFQGGVPMSLLSFVQCPCFRLTYECDDGCNVDRPFLSFSLSLSLSLFVSLSLCRMYTCSLMICLVGVFAVAHVVCLLWYVSSFKLTNLLLEFEQMFLWNIKQCTTTSQKLTVDESARLNVAHEIILVRHCNSSQSSK